MPKYRRAINYDLSREAAMQDFAVRANLIPKDRVLTEEENHKKLSMSWT